MTSWWEIFSNETVLSIVRAILLVTVGFVVGKLTSAFVGRVLPEQLSPTHLKLLRRIVFYLLLGLFTASALRELGFSLATILGAAGIFSVAIGFASQTSASNIISGFFLMLEKPFSVSDVICVGSTTGEVLSIDLLSVKLRTFDNRYVRIPNELLLKSETTTLTRFPIRRADLMISVAYKENIKQVREALIQVADHNPLCLEEPKPLFIFQGFGDSALEIQFSVWAKRENFLELKNTIYEEIKTAFDTAGIEIPFPHLSIYTGSATDPFPVQLMNGLNESGDRPAGD
jgi:small-conductance mechanosensitive channel